MMTPLLCIDQDRFRQFSLIGSARDLFRGHEPYEDSEGITWALKRHGGDVFAVTWLGPGWVFDPKARERWAGRLADSHKEMASASASRHRQELDAVLRNLHLGKQSERLLWLIQSTFWKAKGSVLRIPDYQLAEAVWGEGARLPRHWRQNLLRHLEGLTWLHVAECVNEDMPEFDRDTVLLTHAADLRGKPQDECGTDCSGYHGRRHHHYLLNLGCGFVGALEEFARDEGGNGIRGYEFPQGGPRSRGPSLYRLGKQNRLVSVFLPAKLGDPVRCGAFTESQHRLLQALVRETTRKKKERKDEEAEVEVSVGNEIVNFMGTKSIPCPLLSKGGVYVGFNGNKKRKGQGYRLSSEKGWLHRAGYPLGEMRAFLHDLSVLAKHLRLIVIGVGRGDRIVNLNEMLTQLETPRGRHDLKSLHMRVHAPADWREHWKTVFLVPNSGEPQPGSTPPTLTVETLLAEMTSKQISRRALAVGLGQDHSFVSKILRNLKPPPQGFTQEAYDWLTSKEEGTCDHTSNETTEIKRRRKSGRRSSFNEALNYLKRGWCVVPQRAGKKKPMVRWKHLQQRLPTRVELKDWFTQWPDAGLALVLGPVSGVFVIDVDGPEAHAVLLDRLGREPVAPKAISGSHKPFRYHLYFQCPDLPTKAKQTPWHPQLEFRGLGGIVVIPPSLHESGNRYAWEPGGSPEEMQLPEVPSQVLEALRPTVHVKPLSSSTPGQFTNPIGIDGSKRTLTFLSGKFAEGPKWNERLFNAACDLSGRGMSLEKAAPLLLSGARPWNRGEEETALRTIQSAYSKPREPARF